LIAHLNVHFLIFIGLILLSILGFTALWFKSTQAHSLWLLLVIGSRDVLASLQGGNVELLLLFVTVLAARCLWDQRLLLAAFLITLVLLIKPFYTLFFVAFMLLREVSPIVEARLKPHSLAPPVIVILALIAVEIYRWGSVVRAETLNFLLHATDYLWFALPVAEQTPLSMWNRTPLQGLINAGVPVSLAQMAALGLWLLFLGITLWWARKTPLTFPLTFALALTLLYWGRPAGYGFNYLEVVVAVVVWPTLQRWQKPVFVARVAAVMASRWWALAQTLRGEGMALLTLQSATGKLGWYCRSVGSCCCATWAIQYPPQRRKRKKLWLEKNSDGWTTFEQNLPRDTKALTLVRHSQELVRLVREAGLLESPPPLPAKEVEVEEIPR
jgi:hypothetical protein